VHQIVLDGEYTRDDDGDGDERDDDPTTAASVTESLDNHDDEEESAFTSPLHAAVDVAVLNTYRSH